MSFVVRVSEHEIDTLRRAADEAEHLKMEIQNLKTINACSEDYEVSFCVAKTGQSIFSDDLLRSMITEAIEAQTLKRQKRLEEIISYHIPEADRTFPDNSVRT